MSDETNKRTHAQRRRLEAQEASRRKLRAGQFIRRLKEIAEKVESAEPSAVPALRLKADIYLRLLAKCLPDLRAVEHSGTVNHVNYDAAVLGLLNGSGIAAGNAASTQQTTH